MTTDKRALAVAAYDDARSNPAAADWRKVAELLRDALPATRRKLTDAAPVSRRPAWWADYSIPKTYTLDSVHVTFADGAAVRCNIISAPGKPPRIAKACRVAIAFYRARAGMVAVPDIVSVVAVGSGQIFDAAACSQFTTDLRAMPAADPAPVPHVPAPAGETHVEWLQRIHGGTWRTHADGTPYRVHDAPAVEAELEAVEAEPLNHAYPDAPEPVEPVAAPPAPVAPRRSRSPLAGALMGSFHVWLGEQPPVRPLPAMMPRHAA